MSMNEEDVSASTATPTLAAEVTTGPLTPSQTSLVPEGDDLCTSAAPPLAEEASSHEAPLPARGEEEGRDVSAAVVDSVAVEEQPGTAAEGTAAVPASHATQTDREEGEVPQSPADQQEDAPSVPPVAALGDQAAAFAVPPLLASAPEPVSPPIPPADAEQGGSGTSGGDVEQSTDVAVEDLQQSPPHVDGDAPPPADQQSMPAPAIADEAGGAAATVGGSEAQAWVIDFGSSSKSKTKRKMTKKEKDAIKESRLRSQAKAATVTASGGALGADSEGNAVVAHDTAVLQTVQLEGLADRAALIPVDLTTTRADLEARLVLRMPRFLCVTKQYPRGCGMASLTSVYNYLYSWLGESAVGAGRPPHSQEELMSVLGFEPPFGEIAWGPFTGNATLIRWFHALNRHFGHRGKAYILYKVHGSGKTTRMYPDSAAALVAVKAALRDPHCALIYHCYNHYMVPIGYQDIPHAQTDFLKPAVPESGCDTTIFIGEVSRGRHEAMYARKWEHIVKDLECQSPYFFNIRHPEQGVQKRESKKKAAAAAAAAAATATGTATEGTEPPPPPQQRDAVQQESAVPSSSGGDASQNERAVNSPSAAASTPPTTLFIPMPPALRAAESRAGVSSTSDHPQDTSLSATPQLPVRDECQQDSEVAVERAHQAVVDGTHEADTGAPLPAADENKAAEADVALSPPCQQSEERPPSARSADETAAATEGSAERLQPPAPQSDEVAASAESHDAVNTEGSPPLVPADEAPLDAKDTESANHAAVDAALHDAAASSASCAVPQPVVAKPRRARPQPAATSAASPSTSSSTTAAAAVKPAKERGNLHCLIIFRNDVAEEHLERYEDTSADRFMRADGISGSSSGSEGSSGSDDDG